VRVLGDQGALPQYLYWLLVRIKAVVDDLPGFISDAKLLLKYISSIRPRTPWTQDRSRATRGRMLEMLVPASCPPRASMALHWVRSCKGLCNHSFSTPFCSPMWNSFTSAMHLSMAASICSLLMMSQPPGFRFSS